MSRAARAIVAAACIGGGAIVAANNVACETLDSPCDVAAERVLAEASGAASVGVFAASPERAVLFFVRDVPPDAGDESVIAIFRKIEVVVLDAAGERTTATESFALPDRLAARQGNTEAIGVAWRRGRALFHWVEKTVATDPSGHTTVTAQLYAQVKSTSGNQGPLVAPTDAHCIDCTIAADAVGLDDEDLVTYLLLDPTASNAPSVGGLGAADAAPTGRPGAFALRADGAIAARSVPLVLGPFTTVPRFDVVDGRLLAVSTTTILPVDSALRATGAALPRPNAEDTRVRFPNDDALLAWSSPADAGTRSGGDAVFQRLAAADGRPLSRIERASATRYVVAVGVSGERVGVLHRAPESLFSVATFDGTKIGDDVLVAAEPSATDERLVATDGGQFRQIAVEGNRVVTREIRCGR